MATYQTDFNQITNIFLLTDAYNPAKNRLQMLSDNFV